MRPLALVLLWLAAAPASARDLLPTVPSEGLRITVSVTCDFEDRWWEATLYPGSDLPLEFQAGERSSTRPIDPNVRAALYEEAIAAFAGFRIDRRPQFVGPGAEREWTGERTITFSAMTLDDELGRVDRIELDIDVMRGRALPEAALKLVDDIAIHSRLADFELNCD